MQIVDRHPLLDERFDAVCDVLGADLVAYRHHAYRVFNFCRALTGDGADERIALAALVDAFRRADLVDVSLGLMRSGLPRSFVRDVRRAFPNAGFHRRLLALGAQRARSHPLSPLPMLRW